MKNPSKLAETVLHSAEKSKWPRALQPLLLFYYLFLNETRAYDVILSIWPQIVCSNWQPIESWWSRVTVTWWLTIKV